MNEPTYEFVKGKGWVIITHETCRVTIKGRNATIINRLPSPGEYVTHIGVGSIADKQNPGFEGHCRWLAANNWFSLFNGQEFSKHYYNYTVVFDD